MEITCPSCGKNYNIPDESIGEQGRKVRCTACDHRWLVMPDSIEDEEAAALAEVLDQAADEIDRFEDVEQPDLDEELDPLEEEAALEAAFDPEPSTLEDVENDADPFADEEEDEPPELPPSKIRKSVRTREPGRIGSFLAIGGWFLLLASVLALGGLVIARDEVVDTWPSTQPLYQALGLPITRRLGLEIRDVSTETVENNGERVLRVSGSVHNVTDRDRDVPMIVVKLLDGENVEVDEQLVMVDQPSLPTESIARFVLDIEKPPATAQSFSVSFDPGR
ncbi:MAG: DUF3426 domain-containing protein [Geminicoccaceae bacterium]